MNANDLIRALVMRLSASGKQVDEAQVDEMLEAFTARVRGEVLDGGAEVADVDAPRAKGRGSLLDVATPRPAAVYWAEKGVGLEVDVWADVAIVAVEGVDAVVLGPRVGLGVRAVLFDGVEVGVGQRIPVGHLLGLEVLGGKSSGLVLGPRFLAVFAH